MNKKFLFLIAVCFLIGATSGSVFGNSKNSRDIKYLTIGSISNTPKQEVAKFQPFIDYLVLNINDSKYSNARVLVANSLKKMRDLIDKGSVDIYLDSPFPIICLIEQTGCVPFLRRWKKEVREYNSVIFVRKDSGINSIHDLKGKMISFEEKFSTSSYFLPKAAMLKENLILIEKPRKTDFVCGKKIGYVFSRDDETTMVWVLRRKVAAGAINKTDYIKLAKNKISQLKILKETIYVPRQIVVYQKRLPFSLIKKISTVLIDMDKNDKGRSVLKKFSKTKKFESFEKKELGDIYKFYKYIEAEFGI